MTSQVQGEEAQRGILPANASLLPSDDVFAWRKVTAESQGLSTPRLDALKEHLAARATTSFLLLRNDRLVYEWYAPGGGTQTKQGTASMAKAIVAGLAVAVALDDQRLALDDPAAKYIPQWRRDPRKSRITLRHLGSHTSGLDDAEEDEIPHDKLTGWKGDFWKREAPPRDSFTLSRDVTPVQFEPGKEWAYSNPGIAMLTYATTAALKDAPQKDIRALLRDRVLRPIGIADDEWSIGYGSTTVIDGLPLVPSWGGGSFTARAMARIARLMLNEGTWDGRRILSRDAVHAVTDDAGTPGRNGIGWWSNHDGSVRSLPRDAFWGSGAGNKVVLVIRGFKLIAVRTGQSLDLGSADATGRQVLEEQFFKPLMDALALDVAGAARRD